MVDTCRVRRATRVTTDVSGVATASHQYAYEGRCRVQGTGSASQSDAGDAGHAVAPWTVSLPISVTDVAVGDDVVILASAHDPGLAGRVLTVTAVLRKTHATARRLSCAEVQS